MENGQVTIDHATQQKDRMALIAVLSSNIFFVVETAQNAGLTDEEIASSLKFAASHLVPEPGRFDQYD